MGPTALKRLALIEGGSHMCGMLDQGMCGCIFTIKGACWVDNITIIVSQLYHKKDMVGTSHPCDIDVMRQVLPYE